VVAFQLHKLHTIALPRKFWLSKGLVAMECCVSVCRGSFAITPGLKLKREGGLRCCGDAPRLRIAATSTLPGKTPGA
jgi:hypothetical protein